MMMFLRKLESRLREWTWCTNRRASTRAAVVLAVDSSIYSGDVPIEMMLDCVAYSIDYMSLIHGVGQASLNTTEIRR